MGEEQIWADMRERLMARSVKELKKLAKEERITLGYAASRKDTLVGEIVSQRRARVHEAEEDPNLHPWRKWNSNKGSD